jgi:hypothetical protein
MSFFFREYFLCLVFFSSLFQHSSRAFIFGVGAGDGGGGGGFWVSREPWVHLVMELMRISAVACAAFN